MAKPGAKKKVLHSGRHASAIKRARQTVKRRAHRKPLLDEMRKAIKAVRTAVAAKQGTNAAEALKTAVPMIAKNGRRSIIPTGRASRTISRLTKAVNGL